MTLSKFCKIVFIVSLCSFHLSPAWTQTKIIAQGDEWKYYDEESAPPEGWQNSDEITVHWKTGVSGLGYGDKVITTEIGYGGNPRDKHLTAYFTKSFMLDDPYKYLFYRVNVTKDDGIVLYLNGHEIFRNNMPLGEITHTTRAASLIVNNPMEAYLHTIVLSPEDLKQGTNRISASVHQGKRTSEDLIFNLEFIGSNDPEMLPLLLKEKTIKDLKLDLKLKEFGYEQALEKKDLEYRLLYQSSVNYKIYLFVFILLFVGALVAMVFVVRRMLACQKELRLKQDALTEKDSEMMNNSLNALNSKQFVKGLKKQLEEVSEQDGTEHMKKELRKIIREISYKIDSGEDWENLKRYFNVVHAGYVNKLKEQHPSLSDVELRHCIFIKLHMETKEIANVLNIEPRSVLTSKYRIKKKLKLGEDKDLKEYLLAI